MGYHVGQWALPWVCGINGPVTGRGLEYRALKTLPSPKVAPLLPLYAFELPYKILSKESAALNKKKTKEKTTKILWTDNRNR